MRTRNFRLRGFLGPCAILFTISFCLLSLRMYVPFEWGDEGYFANAAMRILSGELIFRDFQHNYPPGRMYALAFLIKVFGQDLAVVRLFWVFCHSASVVVGFCVARRIMPTGFALLVAGAILFNNVHLNKTVESLVAALVLLILFRVLERRTADWAAGAAMGALAYFRHDVAVMGLVLFYLQMFVQARAFDDGAPYWDRLRQRAAGGWHFLTAFVLVGAPFALYLVFEGAFGRAFYDLTLAGFEANVALSIPFPVLFTSFDFASIWGGILGDAVVFYTPPLVYAFCALHAVRSLAGTQRDVVAIQILVCAIFGCMVFTQVIPRTDPGHLNKAYIPAHILSFALISLLTTAARSHFEMRRFAMATLFAILLVPAVAIPSKHFALHAEKPESLQRVLLTELGVGPPFHTIEFPHGRYKTRGKKYAQRMRALNEKIVAYQDQKEDETMLVYPAGAIFNFLYGYRSPIQYDVLRPGELGGNSPEVVQELLRNVEIAKPRVMIRIFEKTNWDVASALSEWAEDAGYEKHTIPLMAVWIRPDSRIQSEVE